MSYPDNPFDINMLIKLAGGNLSAEASRVMARQVREDSPGIKRPTASAASTGAEAEVSLKKKKALIAQILRDRMAKNTEHTSHKVEGTDSDEYSRKELGVGRGERRKESEHYKKSPHGYSHQQSFSQVKIAAKTSPVTRRIRGLKARKIIPDEYRGAITSEAIIVGGNIDEIPMVPYPKNDSPEAIRELHTISHIIDEEPLTEDTMELADEEPMELFKRACHALGVEVDDQIAPLLVQDLRRVAIILKYVHLRPRPYELAPYHGIGLTPSHVDNLGVTPSYPSVHSTIGYGLANFYADAYPEYANEFYNVGDTIALQRVQSGQHYPSDNSYAKVVADTLLGGNKKSPETKRRVKVLK
tara:strand:+ start:1275 stop:2345 length:1071 start_codon:yes stop_codon:yes gene_type:complete